MEHVAGTSPRALYGAAWARGTAYETQYDAVIALPEHDAFAVVRDLAGAPDTAGELPLFPRVRRALAATLNAACDREPLAAAIDAANQDFFAAAKSDRALRGCGCVLVAARVLARHVVIAHVGDCRAYMVRDARATRLTLNHGLVEEAFAHGPPYSELAALELHRSVILRAVGMTELADADIRYCPASASDTVVLVTPGCADALEDVQIAAVVASAGDDVEHAARELVTEAVARSSDNLCALVIALRAPR